MQAMLHKIDADNFNDDIKHNIMMWSMHNTERIQRVPITMFFMVIHQYINNNISCAERLYGFGYQCTKKKAFMKTLKI